MDPKLLIKVLSDLVSVEVSIPKNCVNESEYLASAFSERWASENNESLMVIELKMFDCCSDLEAYESTLNLVATKNFKAEFTSVKRVIDILKIALALGFRECIKQCEMYLINVPWSRKESDLVRAVAEEYLESDESKKLLSRACDDEKWNTFVEPFAINILDQIIGSTSNDSLVQWWMQSFLQLWNIMPREKRENIFFEKVSTIISSIKSSSNYDLNRCHKYQYSSYNCASSLARISILCWLFSLDESKKSSVILKEIICDKSFFSIIERCQSDQVTSFHTLFDELLIHISNVFIEIKYGKIYLEMEERKSICINWFPILSKKNIDGYSFTKGKKDSTIATLFDIFSVLPYEEKVGYLKELFKEKKLAFLNFIPCLSTPFWNLLINKN